MKTYTKVNSLQDLDIFLSETSQLISSSYLLEFKQFIANYISPIFYVKDISDNYKYICCNQQLCNSLHLPEKKILGKTDFEIYKAEDASRIREKDQLVSQMSTPSLIINHLRGLNFNSIVYRTTKLPVTLLDGRRLLFCFSTIIPEELQKIENVSEEIKENSNAESLMIAIFNELPTAILIKAIDDDYRFFFVNHKFESMMNRIHTQLIGKTDYEIFSTDEANKYRKDDTEASFHTAEEPLIIHEIVSSADGDTSTHLRTSKFAFTYKGKRLLVCVGHDVTEIDKTMDNLNEALEAAKTADKLKSLFLSNMSHEIRTPLNAIIGFSQLAAETDSKEEREEFFRIIADNNDLLLNLIGDILDISKLESGRMTFNKSLFNFSASFSDIARSFKEKLKDSPVTLISDNPYSSCMIETDRNRVSQVITNFLTNAIKFTSQGHIKMGYSIKNQGLEIFVEDTGIGISTENQQKVFDRFEKLNDFAIGTGLGLPICKLIAEQMGGRIWVESSLEKGSTFSVWIPCRIGICVENDTIEEGTNSTTSPTEISIDSLKLNILIAEDIDANYQYFTKILKMHTLSRAHNGLEALEMIKQHKYDVVFMDLRMPMMDGLTATKEIRKFDKDITIIAQTAYSIETTESELLDAGCNAFMLKPFKKNSVLSILSRFIKKDRK